ncbi:hypothetical protein [Pseudanabaena sp. UWO310]|uniref:hypothetical protein n=1 Tax=Pseudanabaena sp. UWO310 TaxID=2480795 RepID=UPI0016802B2C|nr:hypothetical protein [Pseudanabaena sp. UWO310]
MEISMSKAHQTTYRGIFQHPIAHNLQWHDVRSMLEAIAEVTEEHNGNLKYTRHGEVLVLHPPKHKDLSDTKELMQIRHFLERSSVPELADPTEDGTHLLIVINHHEARIYKTEVRDSVPVDIIPYDSDGTRRHLHNLHDNAKGQPELKSFYEAIAANLKGAEQILIFGSSTGASSAMDYLVDELAQNHPYISKKVVGAIVVNEQHLTEEQLLAQARAFYEANNPSK